jgi:RNA polymerase sigma-70 factor, ECF subfamily
MRMTESTRPETPEEGSTRTDEIRDEAAIIERARRDTQAFAPLYREYVGPVYRYCYRRLGTKELAEDATSQTFTQAIRGLEGFENRSFRAWLFSIAYRVIIDIYRKRRPDTTLENVADPSDPAPTPEETALAREDGRHIRSLLASLTDDQRQVLELRLAGLTGQEIADTLDRSVGSVRLLQHRAIQRLRTILNIDPETGGQR